MMNRHAPLVHHTCVFKKHDLQDTHSYVIPYVFWDKITYDVWDKITYDV